MISGGSSGGLSFDVRTRVLIRSVTSCQSANSKSVFFTTSSSGTPLGGNTSGTRLNKLFKDMVKDTDFETELRPILARYARERNAGERFGDWCDRVVLQEAATQTN
jgi:hypothetical protein